MCSLLSLVVLGVSIAEQDVDPFAKNLRNDRDHLQGSYHARNFILFLKYFL